MEQQPFEDVSPIKNGDFPIVMLVFQGVQPHHFLWLPKNWGNPPTTFHFWEASTILEGTNRINRELVGGWTNPFEKYARQIGSFPQGSGWKLPKILETTA